MKPEEKGGRKSERQIVLMKQGNFSRRDLVEGRGRHSEGILGGKDAEYTET